MRFTDFLRTTVLISAAAATALAAVTVAGRRGDGRCPGRPRRSRLVGSRRRDWNLAGAPRRDVAADRDAPGQRADAAIAPRAQPNPHHSEPALAASVLHCGGWGAVVSIPPGPGRGRWICRHLGLGLAPTVFGRGGHRGTRRRAFLCSADLPAAPDPADPDAGAALEPVRAERGLGPAPCSPAGLNSRSATIAWQRESPRLHPKPL